MLIAKRRETVNTLAIRCPEYNRLGRMEYSRTRKSEKLPLVNTMFASGG
jgi:hypothetical protein